MIVQHKPSFRPNLVQVVVDEAMCSAVAGLLSGKAIPSDREDTNLAGFAGKEIGNFYLLLVAICHQTSPLGRPPLEGDVAGRHLRGWDYLSAKLEDACRTRREFLLPSRWAQASADDVLQIFRDSQNGDRISDPAGRASLIRNLGQVMLGRRWEYADDFFRLSQGRIAVGDPNLLGLLAQFRAYDDPVRKKSYFFLALMRNTAKWHYTDPQNLGPPVDYHEIRGHLRIGTARILDDQLRSKLLQGTEISAEEDIAIRTAVHDAIMRISELSGLRDPSRLHYLFWNVFRSCCTRTDPHCLACPPSCTLPARYVPLAIHPDGRRRCPFSAVCQSAGREPKLIEHHVETDYY